MVAPREPVDRVVDLLVAAPTCTVRAARRAAPLVAELLRRGITVGAPDDHRLATADGESGAESDTESDTESGTAPAAAEPASPATPDATADSLAEALAIDDYDHLAARQVVDRLGGLSSDELEAIEQYERANRHRQTILRRIDQLRT